jgi:hypothetical protein
MSWDVYICLFLRPAVIDEEGETFSEKSHILFQSCYFFLKFRPGPPLLKLKYYDNIYACNFLTWPSKIENVNQKRSIATEKCNPITIYFQKPRTNEKKNKSICF